MFQVCHGFIIIFNLNVQELIIMSEKHFTIDSMIISLFIFGSGY
jgi:hypothetical protein